ncbi:MAG: hypothetical protein E7397_00540 [Ruminococcaceae bacterium]|nr:hypothetical protein [Oscillospiraceae bacterium]
MKLLQFKTRKTLMLYIIIGILHSLSIIYMSILLSEFFSVPFIGNRKIWTVIAMICIISISLFEKKKCEEPYIWIFLSATLITFLTSFLFATIIFFFTPIVDF